MSLWTLSHSADLGDSRGWRDPRRSSEAHGKADAEAETFVSTLQPCLSGPWSFTFLPSRPVLRAEISSASPAEPREALCGSGGGRTEERG